MRHYRAYLSAALLLTVASIGWAEDKTYPIKLHRSSKAGDVYKTAVNTEQTQSNTASMPQMPPQTQNQSTKTELRGQVEVLAVTDKGEANSITLKIEKFTDDAGRELLEAGKVIEIKRDAKPSTFTIQGGGEIPREAKGVLNLLFPPIKDTNEDDVFGSKEPRNLGETWNIDSEKAAKDASKDGLTIDPKDISGKTTLIKVEDHKDAGKVLRIEAVVDVKNLKPPIPPGATVEKAEMKAQLSGLFPVDASKRAPETTLMMDMTVSMTANGLKIDARAQMKLTEKITPASATTAPEKK